MRLTLTENEVIKRFEAEGYKFIRSGHPDFLFYKEVDGKIIDVKFVEVKSARGILSPNQKTYLSILKALNLNVEVLGVPDSEISSMEVKTLGIPLICQRCKKKWHYTGKKHANSGKKEYVACPRCKSSVKLKENEIKQK